MELVFECSTWYLTSSLVWYQVEHLKRNSISTSSHVLFCLLLKHSNDELFWRFSEELWTLSEVSEDSPKVVRRLDNRFRTFSENLQRLPKISEDFRRQPKISEEELMMFRSHSNTSIIRQVCSTEILSNTVTIREKNSTEIDSFFALNCTERAGPQDYASFQRQAKDSQTNSHNFKKLNWIYLRWLSLPFKGEQR